MDMIYTEDEIKKRCVELVNGPPLPVLGKGDKRFGMTLERYMNIDINSRVTSDIESLDLEIKAKIKKETDLTLFSTKPAFLRLNSDEFFRIHNKLKDNTESLYTDVGGGVNSFGLQISIQQTAEDIEMIIYDAERNINRASINFGHIKHIAKMKMRNLLVAYGDRLEVAGVEHVRFDSVHIHQNLNLTNEKIRDFLLNNKMVYSFRQRKRHGKYKDHGSAFRLTDPKYLKELYSSYEEIQRK